MCIDYCALNKVTIKNKYPISLVADLFDRLTKVEYFTNYEFLVMPFGLTNSPTTFCNFMNDVLFDFLDSFVVIEIKFLGHLVSKKQIQMNQSKVGYWFIIVVVDKFSKYAVFILAPHECPVEEATILFFRNVRLTIYKQVLGGAIQDDGNIMQVLHRQSPLDGWVD
ncbi:hypothetical protein AAG906_036849 [Vitis piasezkii]